MGLLTSPTCRNFLSVARLSVHCMDGWIIHRFLIIVYGQRPWTSSLSSIHGQRPRMTLLSSMGDLVNYKPYSHSITFLSLLGWFLILSALLDMDDPYGWIGDELISRYLIKIYYMCISVCVCLYINNFFFYKWEPYFYLGASRDCIGCIYS